MSPRNLELLEMVARLGSGKLTPREIVESCLEAVRAQNETLRTFISIDEDDIRAQSRRIETPAEKIAGPLKGIPIAVKDLIDVAGQVTTSGSSFFRNGRPAEADAPIIRRLRGAGAVIFGKTNLHEFAWGGTSENPHYGACRNPWNPEHCAGGSSGGSAAAVAARMCPGALGTDTLGSIRIPSSFCGVVGLKPTFGLLPTEGIFPLGYTFDHVGPMARTVADVARIFDALLDAEGRRLLRRAGGKNKIPRRGSRRLEGIKIGRLPGLVPRGICHEVTWERYERSFDLAAEEGASVIEERFPDFETALGVAYTLTFAQASEIHRERMAQNPEGFGKDVRSLLELGFLVSGVDYIRAQRLRAKLVAEGRALAERVDAWIFPTTPKPASRVGEPPDPTVAFFTAPICALGFPSIAVPSGMTSGGLPVSIQIIAGPHQERRLISIASVLEERLAFPKQPPVKGK